MVSTKAVDDMSRFTAWLDPTNYGEIRQALEARPSWISSADVGGCDSAEIAVSGPATALWDALNWLKRPVVTINSLGNWTWWGYVHEVRISLGGLTVGVSLERMFNYVNVVWTEPGADGTPERKETGWAQDSDSVLRYGYKELLYTLGDASQARALAKRADILAQQGKPRAIPIMEGETAPGIKLICKGWWSTLGWRYYKNLVGRVIYDPSSSGVQTIVGFGFSSNQIGFWINAKTIHDLGGRLKAFSEGDVFTVSGSASNNGSFTVTQPTSEKVQTYTAATISFDPLDDILDSAGGLGFAREGAMVLATGTSNAHYHLIKSTGSDHITVETGFGGSIVTEGPHTITLTQGNEVVVANAVVKETPGATVTITGQSQKISQIFRTDGTWLAGQVAVKVGKTGTPADNFVLELFAVSGGNPTGSALDSGTLAPSLIKTAANYEWITLNNVATLTTGTDYALVARRSGSVSATDYFTVELNEEDLYSFGAVKLWDGSAWVARATPASMPFKVYGVQDTASQIKDMLNSAGQFFSLVDVPLASGVYENQWRDGDRYALDEITALINTQTSSGQRMLSRVTAELIAQVFTEPTASDIDDRFGLDGVVRNAAGGRVEPGKLPAGRWLVLDRLPTALDVMLQSVSPIMVERAEYDCEKDAWRLTPRGAKDVLG